MRRMKDSGIEWIGKIPEDWEIIRGKYVFSERHEKGNDISLQLLSPTQKYGVIPQIMYDKLSGAKAVKVRQGTDLTLFKTIHRGDYCISLRSFQGGFEYSKYEGVVSPAYHVFFATTSINDLYYKFLFKTKPFINKMALYSQSLRDGKPITFLDFAITEIPMPSLSEQNAIACFLETKINSIDSAITHIQSQIQSLEEYKKSIITKVVTKGLDPNAEMKDSGIEWIGEIPKDWGLVSLKNVFKIYAGATPSTHVQSYWDGNVKWVTPSDFKTSDKYVSFGHKNITLQGLHSCSTKIIPENSIIFSKRAPVGTVAINTQPLCTNQGCLACVPKMQSRTDIQYFYYFMSIATDAFTILARGTTFLEISADAFGNFKATCPSMTEQQAIVHFLNTKCSSIDSVITKQKALIDKLMEYKQSLIYNAVTGKIDCRKE